MSATTDEAAKSAATQNMMATNPGCMSCMMGCMTGSADMVSCIMGCVKSPADAACDMPTLMAVAQSANPGSAAMSLMATKPKCASCLRTEPSGILRCVGYRAAAEFGATVPRGIPCRVGTTPDGIGALRA